MADFQIAVLGAEWSGKWLRELKTLAKERAVWLQIKKDWILLEDIAKYYRHKIQENTKNTHCNDF